MNKFSIKSTHIPKAATLIAAVLFGLSGARSVNVFLLALDKQPQESESNSLQHQAKSTNRKVDYGKLVDLHLLGKVENENKQVFDRQEIIKAPETNLNLKLIGVLFNGENEDGYAIISESGKEQKTFHKGDRLPGNATLYALESSRVILERNGRHEALTLLKPDIRSDEPPTTNNNNELPSTDPSKQAWRKNRIIKNRSLPEMAPRGFSKTGSTF